MSINISVGIVSYNRSILLERVLHALNAQTADINRIVIYDNASDAQNVNNLRKLEEKYTNVVVHYGRVNSGGAGGFAWLYEHFRDSEDDFFWFMDDDVVPDEICLDQLLVHSKRYDILQPARTYSDGTLAISEARSINLSNPLLPLKRDFVRELRNDNIAENIACIPFEGPLISKRVLCEVEGPISSFFILADDTEYSIRVVKSSFKIGFVHAARMQRLIQPDARDSELNWKFVYHLKNHRFIDRMHGSWLVAVLRPCLLSVYYLLTSIFHRRSFTSYKNLFRGLL